MAKVTGPEVKVGSIWVDNLTGRSIQVEAIDNGYAVCKTITNSREIQRQLILAAEGRWLGNVRDMVGAITRIRLDRFRPVKNGFTHFTDAPEVTDEALAALFAEGDAR